MFAAGAILGGKYEIVREIGRGGMSVVYMARDINIGKIWAVKMMNITDKAKSMFMLRRFREEADVLKRVDHPVLPRIVDIVYEDNTVCVVMDYIEGESLEKVIRRNGAASPEQVTEWAISLCSALGYLHSMNPPVIYRDMKPSNIILKPDGTIKLVDFGGVKEYSVNGAADKTAIGTIGFAAPEQYGDRYGRGIGKTDERTDIYSLGVTMYYLMTGEMPEMHPYGIGDKEKVEPLSIRKYNPLLPAGIDEIIAKCTMADPDRRFSNCDELLKNLKYYKGWEKKYTGEYLRQRKYYFFAALVVLCILTFSLVGYVKIKSERNYQYNNLMNEADVYIASGKYEDAAASYMSAITKVDGSRNYAYLKLLRLYTDYLDDTSGGLSCVTYYIDHRYKGIDKDDELLMEVAVDYFEIIKDYSKSVYYFEMIDDKMYPEARCYTQIAKALTGVDSDVGELADRLVEFERINDKVPVSYRKIINLRFLCGAYVACFDKCENADGKLRKAAVKGIETLDKYSSDDIKTDYYILFNQYLSLAYESLGDRGVQISEINGDCYGMAIECCDMILELVLPYDSVLGIRGDKLREAKYCQKADIYEKLKDYTKALQVYVDAEKEFDYQSIAVCTGHLSLLCRLQELQTSNVENWDYESLYSIYEKGKRIAGIDKDYRWKMLMTKLAPLLDGKGG